MIVAEDALVCSDRRRGLGTEGDEGRLATIQRVGVAARLKTPLPARVAVRSGVRQGRAELGGVERGPCFRTRRILGRLERATQPVVQWNSG